MLADSLRGQLLHHVTVSQAILKILELRQQPDLAHCGFTGPQYGLQSLKSDDSSAVWRRNFISSSSLTAEGMKVPQSAEPSSYAMVPSDVITPDQFIKYEDSDELLIRTDNTASKRVPKRPRMEVSFSEPASQRGSV